MKGFLSNAMGTTNQGRSRTRSSYRQNTSSNSMMNQLTRSLTSPKGLMAGLGMVMGAVESYKMSQGTSGVPPQQSMGAPPPVPGAGAPPPLPQAATPPPVPGAPPIPHAAPPPVPQAAPPPVPQAAPPPVAAAPEATSPEAASSASQNIAIRLIQSMIAAAWADGVLDETERTRILEKASEAGLSDEERSFLVSEMSQPQSIEALTAGIEDDNTKRLMYGLSIAAIDIDSFDEFQYLQNLGTALQISPEEQKQIQAQFTGTGA